MNPRFTQDHKSELCSKRLSEFSVHGFCFEVAELLRVNATINWQKKKFLILTSFFIKLNICIKIRKKPTKYSPIPYNINKSLIQHTSSFPSKFTRDLCT